MPNPKTTPPTSPLPTSLDGWVRKCELDAHLDRHLPIPTQVVSNEEYRPLPQTREQRSVEHHLLERARRGARDLGITRREFLHTTCGMAAAFVALNDVFGPFFRVDPAEMLDPAAVQAAKTDYFIFDVQTHHVKTAF